MLDAGAATREGAAHVVTLLSPLSIRFAPWIAALRKPAREVSGTRLALTVAAGFIILHLLLAGAIALYIDHDELQYGQYAVVILDGLRDQMQWQRPNWREGFALLFGPLVTPFFAMFGATLMTLRIAYVIFASTWAATWAAVARRLAPHAPAWAVAGLFMVPAPFISRYAVSSVAMSTHLGVSTAYGLAMLLLLAARDGAGVRRWMHLSLAGLVAGFGTYGGMLMAVLLPGVVLGAALAGGIPGVAVVLAAMLPGLALAFFSENPFAALNMPEYVGPRLNLREPLTALQYAPGYLPPPSWPGNYLPVGFAYFGLIAAAYALAWRARRHRPDPMDAALLSSALCLLASFVPGHHTFWDTTRWQWDSLRYTAPLLPIAAVLALESSSSLMKSGRRSGIILVEVLLLAHATGFASHVSWHRLFHERISTAWIRPYLRFDPLRFPLPALPSCERHDFYALRQGMAAFSADRARAPELESRARNLKLEGRALAEYWRGVGRGLVLGRANDALWNETRGWDLRSDVHEWVWQGIGMEAHLCDYEHRTEGLDGLVPTTDEERAAYAWGWTRVCTDYGHVPPVAPALAIDRELGRRLRWDLDLSAPGAPAVTDEELQELLFKQWVP